MNNSEKSAKILQNSYSDPSSSPGLLAKSFNLTFLILLS